VVKVNISIKKGY